MTWICKWRLCTHIQNTRNCDSGHASTWLGCDSGHGFQSHRCVQSSDLDLSLTTLLSLATPFSLTTFPIPPCLTTTSVGSITLDVTAGLVNSAFGYLKTHEPCEQKPSSLDGFRLIHGVSNIVGKVRFQRFQWYYLRSNRTVISRLATYSLQHTVLVTQAQRDVGWMGSVFHCKGTSHTFSL